MLWSLYYEPINLGVYKESVKIFTKHYVTAQDANITYELVI